MHALAGLAAAFLIILAGVSAMRRDWNSTAFCAFLAAFGVAIVW